LVNGFQDVGFPRLSDDASEPFKAEHQVRETTRPDLPQQLGSRGKHKGVPQGAMVEGVVCLSRAGFFHKRINRAHRLFAAGTERLAWYDPSILRLESIRSGSQQDQAIGQPLGHLGCMADGLQKAVLGMHEVVGWKDEDRRLGSSGMDIGQWQEDPGGGFAVAWLVNDLSDGSPLELSQYFSAMIPPHHGDDPSWVRHHGRAIQRMLEHRAGTDEGTVLFGPVAAEPTVDERLHPGPLAAGENDCPVGRGWVLLIHHTSSVLVESEVGEGKPSCRCVGRSKREARRREEASEAASTQKCPRLPEVCFNDGQSFGELRYSTRSQSCREKAQVIAMKENATPEKEAVLWEGYAARSQFIWLYLMVAMILVRVTFLFKSATPGWHGWLVGAITLLGIAATLRRWGRYVVTSQRVLMRNGWTGHDIQAIELSQVSQVSIKQGPLADLMGIGTVVIRSGQDDTAILFRGVLDPEDVKQRIQTALVRRSA
jgi:membrane protein YdbS with pleckstrin-like domain